MCKLDANFTFTFLNSSEKEILKLQKGGIFYIVIKFPGSPNEDQFRF